MLNTLARAARDAEARAVTAGSFSTAAPAGSSAFVSSEGDRVASSSEGDFAAAFEKYRAGGLQQPSGSRQQQPLSASENAALLCSAVDLACLREGFQAPSSEEHRSSQLGDFDSCGAMPGPHTASAETAGAKAVRFLGGPDLAALQTAMADLAAAGRTEFAAGGGIYPGSASGRTVAHNGDEPNRGLSHQLHEDDILSSSLFAKLLHECQASGCDLGDLGGEIQGRDFTRVKAEVPERNPTLSPELIALLHQHPTCRLSEKPESSKRLLASVSSTACNSSSNSRRASSCSPGAEEDGSEEARLYKRRILEMQLLDQRRSSFASSSRGSGSSDLRMLAASLSGSREGDVMDALEVGVPERKQKQTGQEHCSGADSPSNPMSPSYLAELQLVERVANGDPTLFNEDSLTASSLRGPLGYYSVCEATSKEELTTPRLYPIVRGVSRDNTKKRWAVYWKGYRRYFYDKFFESCIEAYRRAVQFRQQATTAAAAVAATGNPAHLIAAGLHGAPGGPGSSRQQIKGDPSETVTAVLASAAAAVANQANSDARRAKSGPQVGAAGPCRDRGQDNDRTIVCLYKEAILFVLEDLRNNVLAQYLTSRAAATVNATASAVPPHTANVELAAATTAKRLLDQLLLVHTNLVGNATSTAELQPSLMIVAPCLEDLKLPSQQSPQQQLLLLQSILAMHIQQLLLLSRYLNKGNLFTGDDTESCVQKSEPVNVKAEAEKSETTTTPGQEEQQDQRIPTPSAASAVDVHA